MSNFLKVEGGQHLIDAFEKAVVQNTDSAASILYALAVSINFNDPKKAYDVIEPVVQDNSCEKRTAALGQLKRYCYGLNAA
ncbi:MAG: hypothetical protein DI626_08570 [Micavibrio aeruginosavorus]|uniref:Uncharacterized protein n=1 Tax=Micavibrio aeruginosavorus TaxID=349221 RepID=A0A2W4ZP41_9BACT|nr:MAG: hypothetical protein DI626_08570 [Micavibrio aeruginosavorus]